MIQRVAPRGGGRPPRRPPPLARLAAVERVRNGGPQSVRRARPQAMPTPTTSAARARPPNDGPPRYDGARRRRAPRLASRWSTEPHAGRAAAALAAARPMARPPPAAQRRGRRPRVHRCDVPARRASVAPRRISIRSSFTSTHRYSARPHRPQLATPPRSGVAAARQSRVDPRVHRRRRAHAAAAPPPRRGFRCAAAAAAAALRRHASNAKTPSWLLCRAREDRVDPHGSVAA